MSTQLFIPPADGYAHSITVNGRLYSAGAGSAVAVQSFDAPILQANGWTSYVAPVGETIYGKIRRLAAAAKGNNPTDLPRLQGSIPWMTATVYAAKSVISNAGFLYYTAAGGTSGATAPTQITGTVSDGAVLWTFWGRQSSPVVTMSSTGEHNAALTQNFNANLGLGGFAVIPDGQGVIRYRGGVPTVNPSQTTLVSYPVANANVAGGYTPLSTFRAANAPYTAVEFDGDMLEFHLWTYGFGAGGPILDVIIDGQCIDNTLLYPVQYDNFVTIDFTNVFATVGPNLGLTGSRRHTVMLGLGLSVSTVAVATKPTNAIYYPRTEDDFAVALIGDSQGNGSGATTPTSDFATQLSLKMGWPDMAAIAVAGTGFVNVGPGPNFNYVQHALADLLIYNSFRSVKLIIINSSSNDASYLSTLPAHVTMLLAQIRGQSIFATTPIFVTGSVASENGAPLAQMTLIETAVKGAVAAMQLNDPNLFWYPVTTDPAGPFIFGTGYQGAPNGTGNSDFMIYTDGIHQSDYGHAERAKWDAKKILQIVDGLP